VVASNLPHGRYLQLPYAEYVTDILRNLAAIAPSARFCFISGAGTLHDEEDSNSLARVLTTEQFSVRAPHSLLPMINFSYMFKAPPATNA